LGGAAGGWLIPLTAMDISFSPACGEINYHSPPLSAEPTQTLALLNYP
jgi:hypothetical protein